MRKLIVATVLIMALIASFASCTGGGNVASSNGQVSATDKGNTSTGMTTSMASSNPSNNGTSSSHNIISSTGSLISDIVSGVKSAT